MAKKSLRDTVLANLPRKGQAPWHEGVEAGLREELEAMKADFWGGRLGPRVTKTGLSAAIARSLQDHGIDIGPSGVQRWLEQTA